MFVPSLHHGDSLLGLGKLGVFGNLDDLGSIIDVSSHAGGFVSSEELTEGDLSHLSVI